MKTRRTHYYTHYYEIALSDHPRSRVAWEGHLLKHCCPRCGRPSSEAAVLADSSGMETITLRRCRCGQRYTTCG